MYADFCGLGNGPISHQSVMNPTVRVKSTVSTPSDFSRARAVSITSREALLRTASWIMATALSVSAFFRAPNTAAISM